jgi:hypothetical protein
MWSRRDRICWWMTVVSHQISASSGRNHYDFDPTLWFQNLASHYAPAGVLKTSETSVDSLIRLIRVFENPWKCEARDVMIFDNFSIMIHSACAKLWSCFLENAKHENHSFVCKRSKLFFSFENLKITQWKIFKKVASRMLNALGKSLKIS